MRKVFFIFLLILLVGCNTSTNIDNNQIDFDQDSTDNDIIKDYDDALGVGINTNNFPDPEFINYIIENIDTNKDNYLSNDEINNTKSIKIEDNNNIEDLDGIQTFTNLEELVCYDCEKLSRINTMKLEKLKTLKLCYIPLSTIDLSRNLQLEDVGFLDTFVESIVLYSKADIINMFIRQPSVNSTIDITNCPYYTNNIKNIMCARNQNDLVIDLELFTDKFVNVVNNNTIIKHVDLSVDVSNVEDAGKKIYILGQGINSIKNSLFSTYDEAYNYGFDGNNWFQIYEHKYKDDLSGDALLEACWMKPSSCTYSYEVIVYDEQPF